MKLDYEEVRRIHRLEKNSSRLVDVEQDFYDSLAVLVKQQRENYTESLKDLSSSANAAREFSNLRKMIEEIFAMREKKLFSLALVSSSTKENGSEHLANEEKRMIASLMGLLERHNETLEGLFSENNHNENGSPEEKREEESVSIEIISEVPGFIGTDMKEYGPYSAGRMVSLPKKIAKLFVSKGLGKFSD
ncbi:MAG: hypothetical protein WC602_03670 [archaeon]